MWSLLRPGCDTEAATHVVKVRPLHVQMRDSIHPLCAICLALAGADDSSAPRALQGDSFCKVDPLHVVQRGLAALSYLQTCRRIS
jgi:hypothetical protein